MTVYMVKRGPEPWAGVTIITDNKDFADGYVEGLNHTTKRSWHRVEPVEPLPAGTPVRYWPGARHGEGNLSTIQEGTTLRLIGGTPCQWVTGEGNVSMTHIEPFKDAA